MQIAPEPIAGQSAAHNVPFTDKAPQDAATSASVVTPELNVSERAIVVSRVALALGGLGVAYFGQNIERPALGYTILGSYVAFSLLLLLTTYLRRYNSTWTLASHIVEVSLICVIISATEGPNSPFFVYFTFIVLLSALRWQWIGALLTGGTLSLVLMVMTWTEFLLNSRPEELKELFMRNIYLVIATVLFAFLGDQYRKTNLKLERLRVANELHDGILQTLTAVRIKLHLAKDEPRQDSLTEVIGLLTDEQRRLRRFVSATRNRAKTFPVDTSFNLQHLQADVMHLARLWDCTVSLTVQPHEAAVPQRFGAEFRQIIAEAVANAKSHGNAKVIDIEIVRELDAVSLSIRDNGIGIFPVDGVYSHQQVLKGEFGPRSIMLRVGLLGGNVQIETARSGTNLIMRFLLDKATEGAPV